MPEYTVISRRILTGTISDLPYPARLAWTAILFEAEKLRGRVKLPVRDLAKWASITTPEAAEALRIFQEPDPFSSSKELDGRRLLPVDGEEDWYTVVTWEKHAEERAAFFNRLRQQRYREKNVTPSNAALRSVTKEPEPEPEPIERKKESKALSTKKPSTTKKLFEVEPKELVESLSLDAAFLNWCKEEAPGVDPNRELKQWKDYQRANGYTSKRGPIRDAHASFRTWMRNATTYAKPAAKRPIQSPSIEKKLE